MLMVVFDGSSGEAVRGGSQTSVLLNGSDGSVQWVGNGAG